MKKEYKNFSQIWEDYPNVYGLCVVWERLNVDMAVGVDDAEPDTFDVYICMDEEDFVTADLQDTTSWKHIISTNSLAIAWFVSLEQYAPLQGLTFLFGEDDRLHQFYATQQASFKALTHLKYLDIEFRDKIASNMDVISIPCLPSLHTLRLSGWNSIIFEGILSLDSCIIERGRNIDIEAILQQLNPETLQYLTLTKMYSKFKFPSAFPPFPRLHFFNISGNNFNPFPSIFEDCKQLETLVLNKTNITTLPSGILEMTSLKTLELDKTPLKNGKIIENEADIIALIQQDTTLDIKQKLWAILFEDKEVTQHLSLIELLQLISATKQEIIIQKIMLLCEENTKQNPLDNLPAFTQITLLGELSAIPLIEIKRILKAHNIRISSSIADNTEVVCIGEAPNLLEITRLLAMPQKPIMCLPAHLKAYIYALEKPYLIQADEAVVDNVRRLLTSNDEANIWLALQIMKTGGLPPTFLEHLCLIWLKGNKNYIDAVKELLKKYCTTVQYVALDRLIGSADEKPKILDNLMVSEHLNPFYLLDVMLKYFLPKNYYSNDSLEIIKKIWKLQGALLDKVIEHYITADGTFTIDHYSNYDIYKALTGNDCIKKLVFHVSVFNKPHTHNLILSLPALTDITIIYPFDKKEEYKQSWEEKYPRLTIHVVDD